MRNANSWWIVPACFFLAGSLQAGDWPQILGPSRNGHAASDEKLAARWPAGGPRLVWERPAGSGDAGVAVAGAKGVLFHRLQDEEITECFEVTTGKKLWQNKHATSFSPQVGNSDGPLCVPIIDNNRVITFGAQGVLTCCDLTTGAELWKRKTHADFQAPEGYFGAGSTPLVVGDRVVVNVGGAAGKAGIVAFSLEKGETLWQQTEELASYSAPVTIMLEGQPFIVMVTRNRCCLLEPQKGTLLFQFPFGSRGPTVNGASPVITGNRMLVTSSYGVGSVFGEVEITGFKRLFADTEPLATQYCTPIFVNGYYYAIDGRDDLPPADLKCMDFQKVVRAAPAPGAAPTFQPPPRPGSPLMWTEQSFGYGTLLEADGKLLAAKTDGELVLLRPNHERCEILARAKVFRGTLRALPALSNGQLYVRDEKTLKCLDVSPGG